jgi:putative transposase
MAGIIREMQGTALIINGTADHVHMLARIRPAQSAAEIARVVKANSSKWVRTNWSPEFAWQTGYGVFSVSQSNVAAVKKYIASQEEHHKKHSFQEEFLAFLKKNHGPLR